MARFVPMPITTNSSPYIVGPRDVFIHLYSKHTIKTVAQEIFSCNFYILTKIVWDTPRVLQRESFGNIAPHPFTDPGP